MHIAIVVGPYWPVPPQKYGGTERVVYQLILGLTKLGYKVTLFGSGDSAVDCDIVSCAPTHRNIEMEGVTGKQVQAAIDKNIDNVIRHQDQFDIIHWFTDPHAKLQEIHVPMVISYGQDIPKPPASHASLYKQFSRLPHVSISKAYQDNNPGLNYVATVYNGLDIDACSLNLKPSSELCFVGRFSPEKQPHLACKAAIELGRHIVVAAKIDKGCESYFQKYIQPLINQPLVTYKGEVDDTEKYRIFSRAAVNLHPINVNEAFGLTVIEAALCGTPTVAFDRGSMREVISHGQSGFVVESYEEMIHMIPEAEKLDRRAVRSWAEQFSTSRMAAAYEDVYKHIIARHEE